MKFVHLTLGLLVAFALGVGCASNSPASTEDEEVSGNPPSDEEDGYGMLPPGPDVRVDRSGADERDAIDADQRDVAEGPAHVLSRHEVDALLQKGPSFALTRVQVEPSRADDQFQGFRIVSMHPDARRAVGDRLNEGDVITHLNGVRLEKPDDYFDAWQLLDGAERIRVDLLRDGEPRRVVWRVD